MKEVLIVFPYEFIAYSPTILNLTKILTESCSVKVIYFESARFNNDDLNAEVYQPITTPRFVKKLMSLPKLGAVIASTLLYRRISRENPDVVIAVDSMGLYVSQQAFGKCHFLSLEVSRDILFRCSASKLIDSVAVQSKERYEYLFSDYVGPVFYIPNSPICEGNEGGNRCRPGNDHFFKMVVIGNLAPYNGIELCIPAIERRGDVSLTFRGNVPKAALSEYNEKYRDLLESERLIIDGRYVEQDQVVSYLTNFDAGFCFYDFRYIDKSDFNYISSPSGKLFNYFAAGLPVIASNILAFRTVEECGAGILLDDLGGNSVAEAIDAIRARYQDYASNSFDAGKKFDFRKRSEAYVNYLLAGNSVG